jgi:hypothetical protein
MENKHKVNASNLFQADLIRNRYHFFSPNKAKLKDYYPKELLKLIKKLPTFNKKFKIEVGEIYSVRAFFAISEPKGNEVEYQSGYLDLKLIMKDNDFYIGEVVTALPPFFVLKKGSKTKFTKENILYKPDYKSLKNKV